MNNTRYEWKKIGERIKHEREKLSFSQEELGEKVFVSRQLLSKWEKEKACPTLENLTALCNIFDCEIGYLLCEYNCKTREATDIQSETGLSEKAILVLSRLKYSHWNESVGSLNRIFEHKDFYELLKVIHSHVMNFNRNWLRIDQEKEKYIADALNCNESEVRKYLESSSESTIESILMGIVKNIDSKANKNNNNKKVPQSLF